VNRDLEPRLPKFAIFATCRRALSAFAPKRLAKRRHRAVVGVDADGEGVRLVAIERQGRSGYRLVGISSAEGRFSGRAPAGPGGAEISLALRPLAPLGDRIVAGLGAEESAVALFRPADIPAGDRPAALRYVLEKTQSDFPADDSVVGEADIRSTGGSEWTLVAGCGRAAADAAIAPLVAAGARDVALVPNALGLEAVARLSGAVPADDSPVAIAHLGRARSLLVIVRADSGVVFQRPLRVAQADLSHALGQTVSIDAGETVTLSPAEAMELLRAYEVGQTEPVALPEGRLLSSELVTGLLRPDLERLVLEIGKSLRHFERSATRGDTPVPGSLVISGEVAELKGLDKYLERKLSIAVSVLNPLEGLALDLSVGSGVEAGRDRVALALAIGLALDGASRIDLVPPSVRSDRVQRVARRGVRVAAGVAAALIVALAIRRGTQIGGLAERLDEARSLRETLAPHVEALVRRDALRTAVRRELAAREAACARTARAAPILREIRRNGSPAIFLESLSVEPGSTRSKLEVSLVALRPTSEDALSAGERFVSALSASPLLGEVTTSADEGPLRRGPLSGLRFRVAAAVERGDAIWGTERDEGSK
jgi:Tfp pilus assembly PilM family ATPase